ncbi:TrmH family RNA methyltransferase [Alicyclobacillus sacchari]|uniref:TrmH family RNA methyltransferase n=1 Tax=Alicyclobacillus sacchari TaxID=392010 RepID=A0A4R8LTR4_9BACL|nr:RNA methyltransferase [Alicyclobacillus sacchari]TDY51113.1 TrmH family RNA methyltransferase [Alicyclobacillus sacchari]GMA56363.1 putative tRNA/rRNA methyltransferase YsgA [Alicyclobacillus sacchari]
MYIESIHNERVRAWSQLKTKKGRLKQGRFLAEGKRLVAELLNSAYEVDALLWDTGSDEVPFELREHPKTLNKWFELSPNAFAAVADTTTPQGVIAVAHIPHPAPTIGARCVLLDGIQDPGNVGTLLRTAEAFGYTAVCCGSQTVDPFAPKVVRASMGGMFRLDLYTEDSVTFIERWRRLHPTGRVAVAAAEGSDPCYEANLSGDLLVVIGSEAQGVSVEVRHLADMMTAIPMAGEAESLNAAVAGSVLLYESFRQSVDGNR